MPSALTLLGAMIVPAQLATLETAFHAMVCLAKNMKYLQYTFSCTADTNECLDTPCHTKANCNNTFGSFFCTCFPGYSGDGMDCNGMVILIKVP